MKEKFVQINTIEGYEEIRDCYWISNSDEDVIVNRSTGKRVKGWIDDYGYKRVELRTIDGKQKKYRIHILKAKAFIYSPNPLGYNVVRHLNDIKTDNRLENLAFGTQSDNVKDCIRNGKKIDAKNGKKRSKPVRCVETNIIYTSAHEASRQLSISQGNISSCCNDNRQTAGGLHFEFVYKEVNNNDVECEQIR